MNYTQEGRKYFMKLSGINLNLFSARNAQATTEIQQNQNPFIVNSTNNPFAGGLQSDVFQSSSLNNTQPMNFFAQKTADIAAGWNSGIERAKNATKEFFAPAISFAGNVRAGFNKLNEMTVADMFGAVKKEISLLKLDKDVRKYVKMPVSELRNQLAQELSM